MDNLEEKDRFLEVSYLLRLNQGEMEIGEKTTCRMGENNSKWKNWQRIIFQNIQTACNWMPEKQTTQSKSGKKA